MLLSIPFLSFLSKQHRIELSRVLKTINNVSFNALTETQPKEETADDFQLNQSKLNRFAWNKLSRSILQITHLRRKTFTSICLKLKKRISLKIGRVLKASSVYMSNLSWNNYQDHPGPDACVHVDVYAFDVVNKTGYWAGYMYVHGECFH